MRKTLQLKLGALTFALTAFGAIWSFYHSLWLPGAVFVAASLSSAVAVGLKLRVMSRLRGNMDVIERIRAGGPGAGLRVEADPECDTAGLTNAFNGLLETFERKEAENKRLIEQVERGKNEWEATFDAIEDLISLHDADCRALRVNRALAEKLNARPKDLIGRRCLEIYYNRPSPPRECLSAMSMESGAPANVEVDDFVFEGSYRVTVFPVKASNGSVRGCVCIARDITREKLMREHIFQTEKLSTIGKLVAGLAHELNNPLMGIMGFSQILMDMPGDKPVSVVKDKLGKIYNESLKTAKIVQNLLAFAQTRKTERELRSVNDIIGRALEARGNSLRGNNIEVALDLGKDVPCTMVDVLQMQQVFADLIANSEDAIVSAKKMGRIEITARGMRRRIEITVKDNGPGIPRNVIKKVFDPFFTTKAVGKGIGMGLSTAHGVITEHGGSISISDPPEGGTLVVIELPVVGRDEWEAMKKAAETTGPRA